MVGPPAEQTGEGESGAAAASRFSGKYGRSLAGRIGKWALGAIAGFLLAVLGAVALLNTPLGERFLANRISSHTLPNGLNIRIGRIEGDLYGKAVLHDVILSDTKGVFARIPRAEVDWQPTAWLRNRLKIHEFTAHRGELMRLPSFKPSTSNKPLLPGFDISVDRLSINDFTLASGIAGPKAEKINLNAQLQVENRRLLLDTKGRFGRSDRYVLKLDARPDANVFDLAFNYDAAADGPIAGMLGAKAAYRAMVAGKGDWQKWNGFLVVRRDDQPFAAFQLTNRAGLFRLLGRAWPGKTVSGALASALGHTVAVDASARIGKRRIDGKYAVVSRALVIDAKGLVDLADNRVENFHIDARQRAPVALGPSLEIAGTRAVATADGKFSDLKIDHRLAMGRLISGKTRIDSLHQQGVAHFDGTRWSLPLNATVERVMTGSVLLDPRLVRGRIVGTLRLAGQRLTGDRIRLTFPNMAAAFSLQGDLMRASYRFTGTANARQLAFENIGSADGTANFTATIGGHTPWAVSGGLSARLVPVTNATLQNLAGNSIAVKGGLQLGAGTPIAFNRLRIDSAKLHMMLDGRVAGAATTVAGNGRQAQFGRFTVQAQIGPAGPKAVLVFANPYPAAGLRDVRLALAPDADGFRIETQGQSTLGPFKGVIGLQMPAGGTTQLAVRSMTVNDTAVTGAIALAQGGAQGMLAFHGGGLDGTVALTQHGGGQGIDVAIKVRNASFGGTTALRIASADIRARGMIASGHSTFTANLRGAGLSYGTLFFGRFAAQGQLADGVGHIDASIAGRQGSSIALDLNGDVAPGRIAVAVHGELAGKTIAMPRRAVLTSVPSGGWRLAPTYLAYGGGSMIADGSFGGGDTAIDLQLAKMPLSLTDLFAGDLGLGGTVSGLVNYRIAADGLPRASAKVKIDGLTRSGLVLTSRPVNLALVGELSAAALEAKVVFANRDISEGRLQASITRLPAGSDLMARLRSGRLFAQLRYKGAAESIWRLAAVEAFDMTGPVSIAADARGTLADPQVTGSVESDRLAITSGLSGTRLSDVRLRGNFNGSRLAISSFAGRADNGGTVTGSGIVDLAGLGERVQGEFLRVRGPALDIRIAASNAHLVDANGLSATVSGPLRIISDGVGGTIAGRVRIDRASWQLGNAAASEKLPQIATREINVPPDMAPPSARGGTWRYLVDAAGSSRIDVRGLGLDSEWGANIILRGTTDDPRIGGRAQVVRGSYSFAGTRFTLTRGRISFDESVPIDPRLDIAATTATTNLAVTVTVTGNAQSPEISFTSSPPLPEEEILSRLLFGGSITSLSATDALQLGAAVASLRGGGGMDPINRLRSAIGLDRLRLVAADPALRRQTGIALGKNIGRRFYVELITDGRGYSATDLEFRVTGWLSLLATVSTVGRQSVVAKVSRDY